MNQDLYASLKEGIVTVKFTKTDGTERTMKCTQCFEDIPLIHYPKQETMPGAVNENLAKVFDVEADGWRSFRKDSVISWSL